MSDERSVLDVVEAIDRKLDEKSVADEARFMAGEAMVRDHEHRLGTHEEKIADHEERLRSHDVLLRDQASLLTSLGHSTARAVDTALGAMREAAQTKDEALKIVESAIRMHSASIGATVSAAVKAEIGPVVCEVDKLKDSNTAQNLTLASQDVKLDTLLAIGTKTAAALGNRKLRILVIVCIAIGALGGSGYAAYSARQAVNVPTTPTQH